jgi:type IV secretion system protein VirD4
LNPWDVSLDLGRWVEHHRSLVIGGCLAGPFLAVGLTMLMRGRQAHRTTTHGSARWATYGEVKRSGLSTTHGVVLGTLHGQTFYDNGPNHVLLCGRTRSNKGICHIIPTLRMWRESALICDPKDGENYAATHEARAQMGQRIAVFKPYDSPPHACINVGDMIRFEQPHEVSDVRTIAESLMAPHKMVHASDTALHFRQLATWVIQAGLLHLGYVPLPGTRRFHPSLPGLLRFLTQYAQNLAACLTLMSTTRHLQGGVHPAVASWCAMIRNITNEREMSGLWTTAIRPLEIYLDPLIAASTSSSTVALTDLQLGKDPMSLYLLAPSPRALLNLYPVYRVILDMGLAQLMHRPVTTPAHRLLVVADELPAYGYSATLDAGPAFIAGYGMKAFYAIQDLDQFEETYGAKNQIWGNMDVKLFHTPSNERTAERLSKYFLGEGTVAHPVASRQDGLIGGGSVSHQHVGRALLTIDELMGLDLSQVIVRRGGTKPMLLGKLGYDPRKAKEAA